MFRKFNTLLLAAIFGLAAVQASAQTVEIVTGVGFGASQPEAFQNAIRAWLIEAIQLYGSADFGSALTTEVNCFEQAASSGGATTFGVEVIGDPTAAWSCSVAGIPASAIGN